MYELDVEQGSREWHEARHGIVTGTRLKSALGSPSVQKTLMAELIAERMTELEIDDLNTPAVVRGRELEPIALKKINEARGIDFRKAGMLMCDEIKDFGLSPDAVKEIDGTILGGLEIKCPSSKKHVEYLINNEIPKEYEYQVLAPFLCSDTIQWWAFASFDDRNYERPIFYKKVYRHELEVKVLKSKLIKFLEMVNTKHMELTF